MLCSLAPALSNAAQVTLSWDPIAEPDLAGYKLHYGISSRSYEFSVDVGNATSYTLSGLLEGQIYYFAVTAYDRSQHDSVFSNEVMSTAPLLSEATLVAPSGTINTATPTYTWNAVSAATWYQLWVTDSTSTNIHDTKIREWYQATDVGCGNGMGLCSVRPVTALASGAGQWWIQTWINNDFGPWSSASNFTIP